MTVDIFGLASSDDETGAALLTAQFREMREQLPIMYGGLLLNMVFLSFVAYGNVPNALSVGVPGVLGAAVAFRALVWLRKSTTPPPAACIRRQLPATITLAGVFTLAFCGCGLTLFEYAGRTEAPSKRSRRKG